MSLKRARFFIRCDLGDGCGGWVSGGEVGSGWVKVTCSGSEVEHVWLDGKFWGENVLIGITWICLMIKAEGFTVLRLRWASNPTSSYSDSELEEKAFSRETSMGVQAWYSEVMVVQK